MLHAMGQSGLLAGFTAAAAAPPANGGGAKKTSVAAPYSAMGAWAEEVLYGKRCVGEWGGGWPRGQRGCCLASGAWEGGGVLVLQEDGEVCWSWCWWLCCTACALLTTAGAWPLQGY